jgi:Ca-activated chloride channel family protein
VLQQAVRLNGSNPELVEEIRRTALRYGLLSEYTAYLVQEPNTVAGRGGAVGGVNAPAPASGAVAVRAAEMDRVRREAKSASQVQAADEALFARRDMGQAQHVGGRVFVDKQGVWTDLMLRDSLPVVTVEPFSPAYFELLRRLPELGSIVQRFDRVVVAGERVNIRFAPGGMTEVREIATVVRRFRAS